MHGIIALLLLIFHWLYGTAAGGGGAAAAAAAAAAADIHFFKPNLLKKYSYKPQNVIGSQVSFVYCCMDNVPYIYIYVIV